MKVVYFSLTIHIILRMLGAPSIFAGFTWFAVMIPYHFPLLRDWMDATDPKVGHDRYRSDLDAIQIANTPACMHGIQHCSSQTRR